MYKNVLSSVYPARLPMMMCVTVLLLLAAGMNVLAQPALLKVIPGTSKSFVSNGDATYFASGDTLWISDGTESGTKILKTLGEPIVQVNDLETGNSFLIVTQLTAGQGLWKSDGTAAGTTKLGLFTFVAPSIVYNGSIYLAIDDGVNGRELWKYTPPSSLQMVKDIYPGSGAGFPNYWVAAVYNNTLFFKGETADGADIWKTTGTATSTQYAVNASAPFYELVSSDGFLYFDITYGEDYYDLTTEIWKTQGTQATTTLVKRFRGYQASVGGLTELNGTTVFMEGSLEDFLYRTEGTEATTTQIKQIASGEESFVQIGPKINNNLILWSETQTFPDFLWKTDATTGGTQTFYDLADYRDYDGTSDWLNLTPAGDLLFFADIVAPYGGIKDQEIFKSDLTSNGTTPLSLIYNMSFRGTDNIVALGDDVLFTTQAYGETEKKLWFYDPQATPPTSPCGNTAGVVHELWKNVNGTTTATVPVATEPDQINTLNIFEGPTNSGDHYGSRYRALLCVPQTGDYKFWIASNDHSDLFLSTDATPANKRRIAYVSGATTPRQYNKYASQQSALIRLEQGKAYYIEALHKEGVGTDHVSVGMQLPDGTLERPIPGSRLVPYSGEEGNTPPSVTLTIEPEKDVYTTTEEVLLVANASDTDGIVTRVKFEIDGQYAAEVYSPPYEYETIFHEPGTYQITAVAYDNDQNASAVATKNITVMGCMAKGYITREVWRNAYGTAVSDIPTNRPADEVTTINFLEAPSNIGDHYGTRIRGYVCAPVTGNYQFEIPANDQAELWLSTDENPANKVRIAYAPGASAPRTIKFAAQRSGLIPLQKDHKYYIEVLHKEGVGTDHVSVGWQFPTGTNTARYEMPINGTRLSPYEEDQDMMAAAVPVGQVFSEEEHEAVHLTPNPVSALPVKLHLKGYDEFLSGEMNVEITTIVGSVIRKQSFNCDEGCEDVTLNTETLTPGVYLVNGMVNGRKFSERLLVR